MEIQFKERYERIRAAAAALSAAAGWELAEGEIPEGKEEMLARTKKELATARSLLERLLRLAGLLSGELREHSAGECMESLKQIYRLGELAPTVEAFLNGGDINEVEAVQDAADITAAFRVLAARVEEANSEAGVVLERCEANSAENPYLFAEAVILQTLLERAEEMTFANVQALEEDKAPVPARVPSLVEA